MAKRSCAFALTLLAILPLQPLVAADHREAPAVNGAGEGDITDVFAFLDPNDANRVILAMGLNPFAVPAVTGSYKFSPDFLYQFKVDTSGDAREDFVVQVVFDGVPPAQSYRVYISNPDPSDTGAVNRRSSAEVILQGAVGGVTTAGDVTAFVGLRDDPFVVDVGQFFRILSGSQDVFRGFTTPVAAVGALRGRAVRADGTSGIDSFGGFNASYIVVSFPKIWLGSPGRVGVWGTVSAPVGGGSYIQFERMGQQLFATVFVPTGLKDVFNFAVPSEDVARFSSLVPDALTTADTDTTGNTLSGRRTVLGALGLTSAPNGAPLLLPENFGNTNRNLIRVALLPDMLRLDTSLPPNDLAIGQFGLQNGRRPGDDVVDIALRLLRELADVNFPSALGVPGSGPARAGALNFSDRRVFAVLQGTDFVKADGTLGDLSTSGGDRPLANAFPYFGAPHPLPGEEGTVGFPAPQ
jgi:hypothetical protein